MNYQACCPKCGAKLSRWHNFTTWRIHFLCRACGAQFRVTAPGYFILFVGFGTYLLWFELYLKHLIPPLVAIGLILLTFLIGVWLFPILLPVRLRRNK